MQKILLIAPNWVGDAVLATPALRAIRTGLPDAAISVLARPVVAEVLSGSPFFDELIAWPKAPTGKPARLTTVARELRSRTFDLAVLFPNSFRSAILAWLARIPRRVGYARNGRAILVTDRIRPNKINGKFVVESMLVYYARLAESIGCPVSDQRMELTTGPDDVEAVDALLGTVPFSAAQGTVPFSAAVCGKGDCPPRSGAPEQGAKQEGQSPFSNSRKRGQSLDRKRGQSLRPLIVLNPGGAFGPSKYWPAERFGRLADRLLDQFGGTVVISGAPTEKPIVEAVAAAMHHPAIKLTDSPIRLSAVRELVRRADLLVTNDTGPRHFAIAFSRPVVTLFGSTDPAWTETHCPTERSVRIALPCSPCQQKTCQPTHHDCMQKMTVEMVEQAAVELLRSGS